MPTRAVLRERNTIPVQWFRAVDVATIAADLTTGWLTN
jgi:hypothetical protein